MKVFTLTKLHLLLSTHINRSKFLFMIALVVAPFIKAVAQQIHVTGIVVSSESSQALPGVTVRIKGTAVGTATDDNGRFDLEANLGDSLSFQYIGYVEKHVAVSKNGTANVSLSPVSTELGETVVVAFGKKKRSDMVGSVTSVNPSALRVPSSNLTTALAGRVAGMIAFQRSGEPGLDNAQFFIRGVTTFGYKKDPLILVDGVEMNSNDLASLDIDDIANFSILKDATATAVYGSRAANGVILITTKEGKVGKPHLSFRIENSISEPTKNIELADPVTYMKLSNEAILTRNPLGAVLYSDDKIENTQPGVNSVIYPANDWRDILFKNHTTTQRFHLSVRGGGGVARYYVSGTYDRDNGLLKVDKRNNFNNNIHVNKYTLRANVNINLTKSTELVVRLNGNFEDYSGPLKGGAAMYEEVMESNPVLFPPYFPSDSQHAFVHHIMFGNYDEGQYNNPYADMVKGYRQYSRSLMLAQLELNQGLDFLTKGLHFSVMMNTHRRSYFRVDRSYNPFWYVLDGYNKLSGDYTFSNINPDKGTEYLGYSENGKQLSTLFYVESRLNYNKRINKSGLSGLLVFMAESQLSANAGNLQKSLAHRNLGFSGRATYDYDKRYYAEFDFGYNGSERFDINHRFGFFPSFGLAWTISNEKFFHPLTSVVTSLRLRATYGIIGNDAIGDPDNRFFYLSSVNMNDGKRKMSFGRDEGDLYSLNGISISRYANSNITWETATKKNFALEIDLFDKLHIDAEYFMQYRKNILMERAAIPYSAGFDAPIEANVGEASGHGWDISMDYKQFLNNSLWFKAMGNFTYASSRYEVFEEPQYEQEPWRSHLGKSINQRFGYVAEKLFVDDYEALNSPKQNFGEYGGGDIKYLDVNKDGQVTEADRVAIGNPTLPEIIYGFGFSGGYKGFDVSAFFQGLANESFWINPTATWPFDGEHQLLKAYADSHWSEDDQDVYALFPRLSPGANENDTKVSTWWMRNGEFLRLKQVELGYTLPSPFLKKIHVSTCRVYLNATNLLCFSHFKLWDVEMGGDGLGYPIQRVFNIGLDLSIN